ncbi:LOW QUALITY PROTEIN: prospero homeobox 3 [Oncorhynchus tshawytscha]|uniref:LOW QUALITY PROTEIN: prospero homeobox 3 n=1 Tax=Oncorhynchus tshawytscha TaxID=74940 RepID=UPI001C3D6A4A|nr:LOW QUALITY PROTEIN: prospero homeobox 3 [Oncorhynchus tshawytscha]
MDSPSDLFGHQSSLISPFDPYPNPSDHPTPSGGGHGAPNPSSRPPYPLIHHLLQPGGVPMRVGGQLHPQRYNREEEEEGAMEREEEEEEGMGGGLVGVGGKRLSGAALVADWSYDMLRVKRLRLESLVKGDGEIGLEEEEERGRRSAERGNRERGREERRKEREELKEQLEEARGRLKTLQEKVWKAFGERPAQEERRKRGGREEDGDGGMDEEEEEEEETAEGVTEEEEGGEIDDLPLSFIPPSPPFYSVAKRERKARDQEKPTGGDKRNVNGGGGCFWRGFWRGRQCGGCGVVRGEWEGFGGGGGSQKFAQALKQELGSAVARVIDRVLRLYTQNQPLPPSVHPSILSSGERGNEGGDSGGVWATLREREERRGRVGATHDATPPKRRPPTPSENNRKRCRWLRVVPTTAEPHFCPPTTVLTTLSSLLTPSPSPSTSPPPRLPPPVSRHKDSSPFLPPSSCPLPLPLLHYTMQQLFTRSLSHLPPLHKGNVMNSDAYMEGNPFPPQHTPSSSHPSFPPLSLALMGGLDRLDGGMQHLHDRERDGGMRGGGGGGGDGGMRGGGGGGGGDGGMDSGMYLGPGSSQEGLSPCHLKKAKLMFFYARYPSSNTLKTYFPDVKFNRCVTSQLIKWFSNFREFFYIQMERFARQAARDGAPCLGRDSREPPLRLGRDTELYRILNMHYNKSNDYQVPDRFVEIAELALREFFTAIQTGRDSDPCWKKSIYKMICKLDSPVPDSFRLPGCPIG